MCVATCLAVALASVLTGYSVLACSECLRACTCSCKSARSADSDTYIFLIHPLSLPTRPLVVLTTTEPVEAFFQPSYQDMAV